MKKIISIALILLLTLTLSGCSGIDYSQEKEDCEALGDGYDWREPYFVNPYCYETERHFEERMLLLPFELEKETFYTQEEVDEGFEDAELYLQDLDRKYFVYTRSLNERVMELESELRDFDRFEYEDLIEFENGFDAWTDMLDKYLQENYQPLDEECDSNCQIDRIDREITLTTIAQIDLILYGLENSQEPLTDEEQYVLDLYIGLRELLYLELENE